MLNSRLHQANAVLAYAFVVGAVLATTGCATLESQTSSVAQSPPALTLALDDASSPPSPIAEAPAENDPVHMYRAMSDRGFRISAVDTKSMPATHVRQVVDYRTDEKPGTVIVDQKARYLYFVMPDDKAMRYAIGVGQGARVFRGGDAVIERKAAWPRWVPTDNMIRRNPKQYERFRNGVAGGPGNPMGARALYMHRDGRDTYYRVHGTNDPSSIRKAVSAGCIRLLNQDIIDLHDRVSIGARIVVI